MINSILLYSGSAIIFLWGIGHLFPTKSVVKGFGEISEDNLKIITMEWIAEGLTLCFIGLLAFLTTIFKTADTNLSYIVYFSLAGMLIILAILSLFTGAKTSILPMKLCPIVKNTTAMLFILGNVL
ncbi:hypothetical protein ACFL4T_12390 [candidate division KSB1 bacterium]